MRPLIKAPKPDVLVRKGSEWTQRYLQAVADGDPKPHEKWRHPEIGSCLKQETHGFCAYCEAQIMDVTYPHVEHLAPKSARPELAHEWTNLTWACPRCNVGKAAAYEPAGGILNPYVDEIANHLEFHGDFVDCPLGDRRGALTIMACALNRMELVQSRANRLAAVRQLAERWHLEAGAMREVLEQAIRLDAAGGEFSATVIAYLDRIGFPITAD